MSVTAEKYLCNAFFLVFQDTNRHYHPYTKNTRDIPGKLDNNENK